jgi:DNA-binding Xre family transcriptional regulator
MSEAAILIDVLKKALRQRGLTYAKVGKGLGLSESSVKRMFSKESLSLNRLEQICSLMSLEMADLLELTRHAGRRVTELTKDLVSQPKMLLVAILAISHWTAAKILDTYQLSEAELTRMLARLDRMGIIELLPDNRIKVRLARNFIWRKAGPIQQFFEARVQKQFFASSFLGPGELRVMVHGSLSGRSIELLQQRMRKIGEEGTTLLLAIRPWELGMFTELRRKKG